MEHGAWSMEHGAWSMEHGAWSMEGKRGVSVLKCIPISDTITQPAHHGDDGCQHDAGQRSPHLLVRKWECYFVYRS